MMRMMTLLMNMMMEMVMVMMTIVYLNWGGIIMISVGGPKYETSTKLQMPIPISKL